MITASQNTVLGGTVEEGAWSSAKEYVMDRHCDSSRVCGTDTQRRCACHAGCSDDIHHGRQTGRNEAARGGQVELPRSLTRMRQRRVAYVDACLGGLSLGKPASSRREAASVAGSPLGVTCKGRQQVASAVALKQKPLARQRSA
eukprot:1334242-Pleurochrysis_carterae.AAC.2